MTEAQLEKRQADFKREVGIQAPGTPTNRPRRAGCPRILADGFRLCVRRQTAWDLWLHGKLLEERVKELEEERKEES